MACGSWRGAITERLAGKRQRREAELKNGNSTGGNEFAARCRDWVPGQSGLDKEKT